MAKRLTPKTVAHPNPLPNGEREPAVPAALFRAATILLFAHQNSMVGSLASCAEDTKAP